MTTAQRPATGIRSKKATGKVSHPFILLEGEEGAGKTWELVTLSRSKRVGQTYILEIGETRVNEYGAIPGANVEVITHDGSYAQILEQVLAVKAEAARAHAAGEPPVVLGIDSFTFLWSGLKDWVTERARGSNSNQRKLAADPAAEIDIGRHLWNDAGSRYNRISNQLLTFPGIVVVTARGKWVSQTDPRNGQPYRDGRKEYSVECHRSLPYAVGTWLRLTRGEAPLVVACKSVHLGVKYERDTDGSEPNAQQVKVPRGADFLDHLIFDVIKYLPAEADADQLRVFTPGELDESERASDPDARPVQAVPNPLMDLIRSVAEAADKAGVTRADVAKEWAASHDGQDIRHATDAGALELLRDDLLARAEARGAA